MTKDQHTSAGSQRALLVLQGMGLVLLTLLLIQIFSTGKGSLLFSAILAGAGIMLILKRPYLGVWIILALWFIEVSPKVFGSSYLKVPQLLGGLLLIPLALSILRDREIWVLRGPQVKIFLLIGLLFIASTVWSNIQYPVAFAPELDETGEMIQKFFTRVTFLIFFLYFITNRQRVEFTVWLLLGLIAAVAMSAFLPALAEGGLHRARAAFSMGVNPNFLAFFCVFGTSFLWFYRSYGQSRWGKIAALPLLFLLPATFLLTGSRNGLLNGVVLTALILSEQKAWPHSKRALGMLFLGTVALAVIALVPTSQLLRATVFDPAVVTAGQASLQTRINKIYGAIEMTAPNPIFGIGIGNFRWMHLAYFGQDGQPHNAYLWSLSAGGIFVLALYLLLFYITYRMLKQLERAGPRELLWVSKGLRVNLILFLVFSAFADFWLVEFLYLIVGLTVAMTRLCQHQELKGAPIRRGSNLSPT